MSNFVECIKYKQTLEGLEKAPYPGELGQQILASVSKKAWSDWLEYQKKVINEQKLAVYKPEAQEVLKKFAFDFFFGDAPKMPE